MTRDQLTVEMSSLLFDRLDDLAPGDRVSFARNRDGLIQVTVQTAQGTTDRIGLRARSTFAQAVLDHDTNVIEKPRATARVDSSATSRS